MWKHAIVTSNASVGDAVTAVVKVQGYVTKMQMQAPRAPPRFD
jgi:hypothetical protein